MSRTGSAGNDRMSSTGLNPPAGTDLERDLVVRDAAVSIWPRTAVTSNQSRLRSVSDAFATARSIAWVTPSGDEPVISTDL